MSRSTRTTAWRSVRGLVGGVALGAVVLAGCGVEVPDEVADRATSTEATSTEPAVTTTESPRSDDDLEQALLDNGYTEEEARCGAENLRDELDADEIDEVIEADDIDEIDPGTAAGFAQAISECLDADGGEDSGSGRGPGG